MSPNENRPGAASRAVDKSVRTATDGTLTVPRRPHGCPCGCRTRLPWLDDPECARHQPLTVDPHLYDRAVAV